MIRRVLIIEDDVIDWMTLKRRLGYSLDLTWVTSLADAKLVLGAEWDCVVCDLNLPDSQGLATLEAVRAAVKPGVLVVVMSGSDVDGVLNKTQDAPEIVRWIRDGYDEPEAEPIVPIPAPEADRVSDNDEKIFEFGGFSQRQIALLVVLLGGGAGVGTIGSTLIAPYIDDAVTEHARDPQAHATEFVRLNETERRLIAIENKVNEQGNAIADMNGNIDAVLQLLQQ